MPVPILVSEPPVPEITPLSRPSRLADPTVRFLAPSVTLPTPATLPSVMPVEVRAVRLIAAPVPRLTTASPPELVPVNAMPEFVPEKLNTGALADESTMPAPVKVSAVVPVKV